MGRYRRDSSSILSGTLQAPSVAEGSKKIHSSERAPTMVTQRVHSGGRNRRARYRSQDAAPKSSPSPLTKEGPSKEGPSFVSRMFT